LKELDEEICAVISPEDVEQDTIETVEFYVEVILKNKPPKTLTFQVRTSTIHQAAYDRATEIRRKHHAMAIILGSI